jgi:hypothetical protein
MIDHVTITMTPRDAIAQEVHALWYGQQPAPKWTNETEEVKDACLRIADAFHAPDDSTETPAQQRYREANECRYSNREVEMAAGAFDRSEEVAQELDDWTHLIHMRLNTMAQRLAALEREPA